MEYILIVKINIIDHGAQRVEWLRLPTTTSPRYSTTTPRMPWVWTEK